MLNLYTPLEIRTLLNLTQQELSDRAGIKRSLYSKLELGSRSWSLSVSTSWLKFVLGELDKLPSGTVDYSRMLDFSDLNVLNESVNFQ